MIRRSGARVAIVFALSVVAIAALASAAGSATVSPSAGGRTPVVLFPAFHFTKLAVTVHNQTVDPACPRSGHFEDWYQNPNSPGGFSQVCRDELLTLRYDPDPSLPMPRRFSNQLGVSVSIIDYGDTASAPFYGALYQRLEAAGYTADKNIRVAGYDARLTPDLGGFLPRTIKLIEQTYRANGDRPVQLVGHSNGPLYAQYLLTHTSRAWRNTYIHGFTPIAGNFPGQGSLYSILFTGLNIENFTYPHDPGECDQQRADVPQLAGQLHERGRPGRVRQPRGGARERRHRHQVHPGELPAAVQRRGTARPSRSPSTTSAS